jgi:hypothetical protein
MARLMGWKTGVIALAVVAGLVYLVSGGGGTRGGGGYVPPQADRASLEAPADFNRAKFSQTLEALAPKGHIARIEKGLSDHEILLTAGPAWAALNKDARQRAAEAFWKAWAALHPENQRYKARLVIVDARGAKIGGSRLLDPSKIWVREH